MLYPESWKHWSSSGLVKGGTMGNLQWWGKTAGSMYCTPKNTVSTFFAIKLFNTLTNVESCPTVHWVINIYQLIWVGQAPGLGPGLSVLLVLHCGPDKPLPMDLPRLLELDKWYSNNSKSLNKKIFFFFVFCTLNRSMNKSLVISRASGVL